MQDGKKLVQDGEFRRLGFQLQAGGTEAAARSRRAASARFSRTQAAELLTRELGTIKALPAAATAEVLYTDNQALFLRGMEAYKKAHDRKFPTLVECLAVAESLGWRKDDETWPSDRDSSDEIDVIADIV